METSILLPPPLHPCLCYTKYYFPKLNILYFLELFLMWCGLVSPPLSVHPFTTSSLFNNDWLNIYTPLDRVQFINWSVKWLCKCGNNNWIISVQTFRDLTYIVDYGSLPLHLTYVMKNKAKPKMRWNSFFCLFVCLFLKGTKLPGC